jgi:hypothetical protein
MAILWNWGKKTFKKNTWNFPRSKNWEELGLAGFGRWISGVGSFRFFRGGKAGEPW